MKYLFVFLLALGFTYETQAQVITTFTGQDTVVNTGTVNLDLTVRGKYTTAVFQVRNVKLSGTVAGNTLFQASVDGTNYVTLDTLVNTNISTNTAIFEDVPPRYPYYRFSTTGTGTMSCITSARAHFK